MPASRSSCASLTTVGGGPLHRLDADDLRAEMNVNANRAAVRAAPTSCGTVARLLERNTELVDVEARGDVRMGAGVDVGIHPQRDPCAHTPRLGRTIDALELACGFGVDGLEAELNGPFDLIRRLADAAEHDVGGSKTRAHRELDFADRVRVDARCPTAAAAATMRERRVRLQRVMDAVGMRAEGLDPDRGTIVRIDSAL